MKELLKEQLQSYEERFAAYIRAASCLENIDEEMFYEILRKASGCKLMIDHVKGELSKLK